jgi:hypothetical protein
VPWLTLVFFICVVFPNSLEWCSPLRTLAPCGPTARCALISNIFNIVLINLTVLGFAPCQAWMCRCWQRTTPTHDTSLLVCTYDDDYDDYYDNGCDGDGGDDDDDDVDDDGAGYVYCDDYGVDEGDDADDVDDDVDDDGEVDDDCHDIAWR